MRHHIDYDYIHDLDKKFTTFYESIKTLLTDNAFYTSYTYNKYFYK